MLLSNMLTGTVWTLDLWVFAIPIALIVGGVLASTRLYGDIFERE
jgi:ABC-type amino acid transport system permease subunit